MIDRLIEASLRGKGLVVLAVLAVMAYGVYEYRRMPVDAFPDVSPNLVQVFTVTEGLAPEEIETYVTYPIETVMNGLPPHEAGLTVAETRTDARGHYAFDNLRPAGVTG